MAKVCKHCSSVIRTAHGQCECRDRSIAELSLLAQHDPAAAAAMDAHIAAEKARIREQHLAGKRTRNVATPLCPQDRGKNVHRFVRGRAS